MTKTGLITEEQVIDHIRSHMQIWCRNYGSHIIDRHINIPEQMLLDRVGTMEENRFIKTVSSFYDDTDGEKILELLQRSLESEAKYIAKWCNFSKRTWLGLDFHGLPSGITAKACRYDRPGQIFDTDRYLILLSKREQRPFFLENAYPAFNQE